MTSLRSVVLWALLVFGITFLCALPVLIAGIDLSNVTFETPIPVVVGIGILLTGYAPTFVSPHLEKGGRTRGLGSMALFGVSYAVASIGCSLPIFLTYMVGNFGRGFASGASYLGAYAAGFGLVITALTITLGMGRRSLAVGLRKVLPFVNRIAGGLLVAAGAYVAYYGSVEIRSGSGQAATSDGITDRVSRWSSDVSSWIQDVGADRIGIVLGLVIAAAVAAIIATRRRSAVRV